jgi:hypothetical protein
MNITETKQNILEGFGLMIEAGELLSELAKQEGRETEIALVMVGLEMVAEAVDDLLGKVYEHPLAQIIILDLGLEVRQMSDGKEKHLALAMTLVGGAF